MMSLLFCESFLVENSPGFKWQTLDIGANLFITDDPDFLPDVPGISKSLRFFSSPGTPTGRFNWADSPTRNLVFGCWIMFDTDSGGFSGDGSFANIANASIGAQSTPNTGILFQGFWGSATTVPIELRIFSEGSQIGTIARTLNRDQWYYMEIEYSADEGRVRLYLDGVLMNTFTGALSNTVNLTHFQMSTRSTRLRRQIACPSVQNLDGIAPSGILSGTRIDVVEVDVIGDHDDFLKSDAGLTKSEILSSPNNMTDFIASDTVEDRDSYVLDQLDGPYAIHAIQLVFRSLKVGEDPWTLKPFIKRGASESIKPEIVLGDTAALYRVFWNEDEIEESEWLIGNLHNTQFGFEVGQVV